MHVFEVWNFRSSEGLDIFHEAWLFVLKQDLCDPEKQLYFLIELFSVTLMLLESW